MSKITWGHLNDDHGYRWVMRGGTNQYAISFHRVARGKYEADYIEQNTIFVWTPIAATTLKDAKAVTLMLWRMNL